MSATIVTRIFKHNSMELADPDAEMSPAQVLEHYSTIYPELNNAQVKPLGIEGAQDVYEFATATGHFG